MSITPSSQGMPHLDSSSPCIARRTLLLIIASLLVCGCAILSLGLNAIPKSQLSAVTFALFYVLIVNRLQPKPTLPKLDYIRPLALDRQLGRTTVRILICTSVLLSLVVPWAWIVIVAARASELEIMAPHLFLMMVQVLFEIWSYRGNVSVVVRIGIPVGFVAYRMKVLAVWVQSAMVRNCGGVAGWAMVALAVANLGFWGLVLFYVLLLKVCPPYFLGKAEGRKAGTGDDEDGGCGELSWAD